MTYEQASARALSFARTDGTVMTYRDGVLHHFNAAITTADHRRPQPRAPGARLPRLPAQCRRRGREGPGPRVRAGARVTIRRRADRAGPQPGDAGHRGATGRRSAHDRRPVDSCRRLPRVERAAGRAPGPQPARPQDRAVRRLHRPPGSTAPAPAAGSDLRHHRVEPAARLRRRGGDQPDRVQRPLDAGAGGLRRARLRRARSLRPRSATWCRGALPLRHSPPRPWPRGCASRAWAGRSRSAAAAIRSARRSSAPPATRPTCRRGCRHWRRDTAPRWCRSTRATSSRARRSAAR